MADRARVMNHCVRLDDEVNRPDHVRAQDDPVPERRAFALEQHRWMHDLGPPFRTELALELRRDVQTCPG